MAAQMPIACGRSSGSNSGSSSASEVGSRKRRAGCLDDARADERADRRGETAQRRAEHEDREPPEEGAPAPVPVGQAAGRDHESREHDRVGVQHPGDRGDARAGEVAFDLREGDVHDEEVEADHEDPDRDQT